MVNLVLCTRVGERERLLLLARIDLTVCGLLRFWCDQSSESGMYTNVEPTPAGLAHGLRSFDIYMISERDVQVLRQWSHAISTGYEDQENFVRRFNHWLITHDQSPVFSALQR